MLKIIGGSGKENFECLILNNNMEKSYLLYQISLNIYKII